MREMVGGKIQYGAGRRIRNWRIFGSRRKSRRLGEQKGYQKSESCPTPVWVGVQSQTTNHICFCREEEFSPLKNGAGAAKDTAETSRRALYAQHRSS